jgi:hypothetical protein
MAPTSAPAPSSPVALLSTTSLTPLLPQVSSLRQHCCRRRRRLQCHCLCSAREGRARGSGQSSCCWSWFLTSIRWPVKRTLNSISELHSLLFEKSKHKAFSLASLRPLRGRERERGALAASLDRPASLALSAGFERKGAALSLSRGETLSSHQTLF